ncbi:MAG: hypothetical protein KDA69_09135 [Planctomycetaceae bacterium]|nr:hypothetical protein [Planctomycetaceae bacterium]MCA9044472.1 hypothetical protein [Planctomycetaceae bacterium]
MPINLAKLTRRRFLQAAGASLLLYGRGANAAESADIESDGVYVLNDTHVEEKHPADSPADPAFQEDWTDGIIDSKKWYIPRKKWGDGNHGVVPENVHIETDIVAGRQQNVLVCEAHGDRYDGNVTGLWGKKERVGGAIVAKPFFASGRFEVVMKIGSQTHRDGGPESPEHPQGCVPAIWSYGYRWVEGDAKQKGDFVPANPLYNPHMPAYGIAANEYWSEIDFPEFGKNGDFNKALYNTFCQNRHDPNLFDASTASDGHYHTFTTEWRTQLHPLESITDEQVARHLGYWWMQDKSVPFGDYLGNPLKRLGKNRYAVYQGKSVTHWIDGKLVGTHDRFVPVMAAQLNLGVWLPKWAGPAPWKTARVSFASVKVWQYDDPGDVRGVLVDDITDNFGPDGAELP